MSKNGKMVAELRVEPFGCGHVVVHDGQRTGTRHPAMAEWFTCAGHCDRASGVRD
ncbi:MAG: hypothetical protein QOK33_5112 [Mycobacterium sp.]|jgi:hypothetical protein|nr:hypothetical protein [Mycobacterium sp.]